MDQVAAGGAVESAGTETPGNAEGVEESQGQGGQAQPGAKDGKKAAAAKVEEELSPDQLDRIVKIKVGGVEQRITVRKALELQQLEQASRQQMTKAAKLEQQVRGLLQKIDDPREYFKLKGIDPEDFSEATLKEKLQMLQETPEQKEIRELREYKQQREEREKAFREAQEKETMTRKEAAAQEGFNKEFVEAWQDTGLPPDRLFGQFLAAEMLAANSRKEPLSWKEAAGKVKGKFLGSVGEMFSKMDAAAIQEILGPKVLKSIREFEVSRISSGTTGGNQRLSNSQSRGPGSQAASNGQAKSTKKASEQEWNKFWES